MLRRRFSKRTGSKGLTRLSILAALATVLLGAGSPPAPPDIVLVVLDTVRADHLSSYGYALETTPAIDALAAVADRYTNARSTSSWTVPSHASMFTGLYPFEHGAQARRDGDEIVEYPLAPEMRTLAEVLKGAGYQTGAVVANWAYLGANFGFAQGFDHYDDTRNKDSRRAPEVNRLAFDWLATVEAERPVFLFLNYMDAHRPYNVDPLPGGRAAKLPAPDPAKPRKLLNDLVRAALATPDPPSAELIARVITQYDVGLAHADLAVESLIGHLKKLDRWDNTLFILTSDHGEFFGEHGLAEHSKDIYEEGVRIPFVAKRPRQKQGRVVDQPISLAAVPALVASQIPGRDGSRIAELLPALPDDPTFAELRYSRPNDLRKPYGRRFLRERTAIYRLPHKAILSSDGNHELYDLLTDPGERHNLIEQEPELAEALLRRARAERERGRNAVPETSPAELSEEALERMRALGYVDDRD